MITHAWKAQQRLHKRFNHLSYRKRPQIAVVAVARELVGFLSGSHARRRSSGTAGRMTLVIVVRRVVSRLDVRALSTALCGPCSLKK